MIAETIPPALAGQRIDRVVAMLTDASRAEAAALIADGAVTVDGAVPGNRSQKLREGAQVEIDWAGPTAPEALVADPEVQFRVVHEDEHLFVIDKPAGVVVHPGAGNQTATLAHGLLARYPELAGVGEPLRPGIVHRLDRGTSGLLLVARTEPALVALQEQLRMHAVTRIYRALVWGHLDSASGLIDAAIGRGRRDPTRMVVAADGKEARTHYEVERSLYEPDVDLLRCQLETGRTHQIRVHLAAIGHPVVGDARYGGDRSTIDIDRPWLHATTLRLTHPVTGHDLEFDSPLPDDLDAVLAGLERR